MLRIRADMNTLTIDESRLQLNDFTAEEFKLEPGMRVLLYESHQFEVEAIIEKKKRSDGVDIWYGILDWDTYRDLPYSGNETQNPK